MNTRIVAALLLGGCTIGNGLTDEQQGLPASQNDATSTQPTEGPDELCPAEGLTAVCDGPEGQGSVLTLTGGAGRFDAVHTGVDLPDCVTWAAEATVIGPNEIEVTYDPVGSTTCPAECGWTFTWWVAVDPGEWTVHAMGDTAIVTVY